MIDNPKTREWCRRMAQKQERRRHLDAVTKAMQEPSVSEIIDDLLVRLFAVPHHIFSPHMLKTHPWHHVYLMIQEGRL